MDKWQDGRRQAKPSAEAGGPELWNRRPFRYPENAGEFEVFVAFNRERRADCRARTGPLFDHTDTRSVVHDVDAIRAAVGDGRLTFVGGSYGTLIGQQYAEQYPDRVRALALDSEICLHNLPVSRQRGWRWIRDNDPEGWAEAVEFDRAIRHGYPHATKQGQELRGQYFLHRSCQPLDQVDLDTPAKRKRHLRLVTAETARDEDGDPDGCSPWSCRSGEPVTGTGTPAGERAA